MGYFDDEKNVADYIRMAEGFDGREFIPVLQKYLRPGATLLELGMGPGKDLDLLSTHFQVTGSDSSQLFLDRYLKSRPSADVIWLDAVTLESDRTFDAIYSNKVLHNLTTKELTESLQRQGQLLNDGGVVLHTLWYGDGEEEFSGLRFVYYTEASFSQLLCADFEILETARYSEIEPDDSFYVVLRKE